MAATEKSKKTNYVESLMNFSKNMMGAGVFSIGVGFKYAGLLAAIVITTVQAALITHSVQLLAQALEYATDINETRFAALEPPPTEPVEGEVVEPPKEKKAPDVSFAGMAKITIQTAPWSFSNKLATIVSGVMQVLISCQYTGNGGLYLVFVGKTMQRFMASFDIHIDTHIFILIVCIPMGSLVMVPNLKGLAKLSLFGNLMVFVTFIIANYYLIRKLSDPDHKIDINYVGSPTELPILFGILLFSFETVAVIFPLRAEMQDPRQLGLPLGIINVGFLIGFLLNMEMGIVSYLAYGNTLHDTILIDLPSKETPARIALIAVSLQIIMTYPLVMYISYKIIFAVIERRHGPLKRRQLWDSLLRLCLILISLILAEAIPYVDLMLSLIGCICAAWLTLFLGPFLNIVINKRLLVLMRRKINLTKNIIIMVLGVIFFISGFSSNLFNLVKEIQADLKKNKTK